MESKKNKKIKSILIILLTIIYFYLCSLLFNNIGINMNIFFIKYNNILTGFLVYVFIFFVVPFVFRKKTFTIYTSILILVNIFILILILFDSVSDKLVVFFK